MIEGYFVEHNGDCWQSVFPSAEAHKSQLHVTIDEALDYMVNECNIIRNIINIIPLPLAPTIGTFALTEDN